MSQAGARGPASPPKIPGAAEVAATPAAPRAASTATVKGPAPLMAGKPAAPLAPKVSAAPLGTTPRASVADVAKAGAPRPFAPTAPVEPAEDTRPGGSVRKVTSAAVVPPPLPPQTPAVSASIPVRIEEEATPARPTVALSTRPSDRDAGLGAEAVRAAMEAATAPMQRAVIDLMRRVEELERRSATAVALQNSHPPRAHSSFEPGPPGPSRAPMVSFHSLDVAAIERDATIVIDGALSGKKRRLRLVLTLVLLVLGVFGALGIALAMSYAPH